VWVSAADGEDAAAAPAQSPSRVASARWARDATSVTLIGDSIAASIAQGMTDESARRGIAFTSRAVDGCGVVRGTPTNDSFEPFPWTARCDSVVPGVLDEVGRDAPSVVLWLSSWETANRLVDGNAVRFGTRRGDRTFLRLVDEAVRAVTARDARLVFMTLPHNTTRRGLTGEFFGTSYVVPRESAADRRDTDRLNGLLRAYVAEHPGRTALVDLDRLVCGGRRVCPFLTRGVALRPDDGRHFAGPGPEWVARRVYDRLGITGPSDRSSRSVGSPRGAPDRRLDATAGATPQNRGITRST
jgi:hypothetical protein